MNLYICKLKNGTDTIYTLYAIYMHTKYTKDFQTCITQCIICVYLDGTITCNFHFTLHMYPYF